MIFHGQGSSFQIASRAYFNFINYFNELDAILIIVLDEIDKIKDPNNPNIEPRMIYTINLPEEKINADVIPCFQPLSAEKIIVLDDGKIVGVGNHEQLLKDCAIYREIAYSQLSEEELKAYHNQKI